MEFGMRAWPHIIRSFDFRLRPLFRILNHHFPTSKLEYSISPEYSFSGGRLDLLVDKNEFTGEGVDVEHWIIYEGKKEDGDTLIKAVGRLKQYTKSLIPRGTKVICLIAARGRVCQFVKYRGGQGGEYKGCTVNGSWSDKEREWATFDIIDHQEKIVDCLESFKLKMF
jgi:hypothetical protein